MMESIELTFFSQELVAFLLQFVLVQLCIHLTFRMMKPSSTICQMNAKMEPWAYVFGSIGSSLGFLFGSVGDPMYTEINSGLINISTGKEISGVKSKDIESGEASSVDTAKAGTAAFLVELEKQRAIKVFGKSTFVGLAITFFAGLCFSLFSPLFNLATNDQWHALKEGVPHLTVYTSFFYFSVSSFVIAVVLNITFLYQPILNLPKSSFKAYLTDWRGRSWALLAGLLCGLGNGLQFMGGQAAGYAAADAVQALPLVSTFWGIVLFGEFRNSSGRTYVLLGSMLSMFVVAVAVLMASSGQRINDPLATHKLVVNN